MFNWQSMFQNNNNNNNNKHDASLSELNKLSSSSSHQTTTTNQNTTNTTNNNHDFEVIQTTPSSNHHHGLNDHHHHNDNNIHVDPIHIDPIHIDPSDDSSHIHLVILIAGMGARKNHPLSESVLIPAGKWFDIYKCQLAMKESINALFNQYASNQVKSQSPHILVKSIDYCSTVREEGGYTDKLNLVTMKSGVQLLRTIANESMIDVLMYNSEKIKKQMQSVAIKQINEILDEMKGLPVKTISIVGHSLGSVLAFDILYQHQLSENTLLKRTPTHCFLLGSPLGLFLTMDIQTNHRELEAFHFVNPISGKKQLLRDLPVYHLYHPYDPVAYRLDPHLDPKFAKFDPLSLDFFSKRARPPSHPVVQLTNAFNQMLVTFGMDTNKINDEYRELINQYEIIDHALPVMSEIVINEYLSASDVHLRYWSNSEVVSFILEKLNLISVDQTTN
ncbi:hypothetical protein C9374_010878 [Naegleria lovaniensis]|uniref:DDHD domain-containing protein n=1 Tax=Naegleria lovaniensis TaxID=51637 RepID=A0AA88GG76_NAELO|nr:uncharacterized protein C9374_010878 [Naegleria lovaniensis]KAG2374308.1 hypothetical protein C9374_010878 [Naegleria lovaniensis]